jgi:hypothetical protein
MLSQWKPDPLCTAWDLSDAKPVKLYLISKRSMCQSFRIVFYYKWLSHVSIDISIGQKNFKREISCTWLERKEQISGSG